MIDITFKAKNDEVLNHWFAYADRFAYPSLEFYTAIETELAARNVPGLELSRIEYAEGGLFSHKRIYLRMIRERLAFDACAAPFGESYFFSCRTVYSPAAIRLWHLLVVACVFSTIYALLVNPLGFTFAAIALVGLVIAICQIFRNTIAYGLSDLDSTLIKTPVVGPIYEVWFRKETYFREDTRLVYLAIVPKIIKDLAEEITGDKGIKLVRQYERAPTLGDLYKPLSQRPDSPKEN